MRNNPHSDFIALVVGAWRGNTFATSMFPRRSAGTFAEGRRTLRPYSAEGANVVSFLFWGTRSHEDPISTFGESSNTTGGLVSWSHPVLGRPTAGYDLNSTVLRLLIPLQCNHVVGIGGRRSSRSWQLLIQQRPQSLPQRR